jgi:hypothetical protein
MKNKKNQWRWGWIIMLLSIPMAAFAGQIPNPWHWILAILSFSAAIAGVCMWGSLVLKGMREAMKEALLRLKDEDDGIIV